MRMCVHNISAQILEDFVQTVRNFNETKRPRRSWGNGDFTDSYVLNWPIFMDRRGGSPARTLWYQPHPWVQEALDGSSLLANHERPKMFEWRENQLQPVPLFNPGDIVWVSFMVAYIVGGAQWYPDMRPVDFVKVGQVSGAVARAVDQHLETGNVVLLSDSDGEDDEDGIVRDDQQQHGVCLRCLASFVV